MISQNMVQTEICKWNLITFPWPFKDLFKQELSWKKVTKSTQMYPASIGATSYMRFTMPNLWIKHMWKACKIHVVNFLVATSTHLKIVVKRHHNHIRKIFEFFKLIFFNDLHGFSMTFPGKMPFFQANIKFNDFSRQDLNSMTFPGFYEPCWETYTLTLTHWGRDKIDAISQTTFSNVFSSMKMFEFRLKFHWCLFPRAQFTISQHWFRWWLGADQPTSHYLNQWCIVYRRIYASLGLNELSKWLPVDNAIILLHNNYSPLN